MWTKITEKPLTSEGGGRTKWAIHCTMYSKRPSSPRTAGRKRRERRAKASFYCRRNSKLSLCEQYPELYFSIFIISGGQIFFKKKKVIFFFFNGPSLPTPIVSCDPRKFTLTEISSIGRSLPTTILQGQYIYVYKNLVI